MEDALRVCYQVKGAHPPSPVYQLRERMMEDALRVCYDQVPHSPVAGRPVASSGPYELSGLAEEAAGLRDGCSVLKLLVHPNNPLPPKTGGFCNLPPAGTRPETCAGKTQTSFSPPQPHRSVRRPRRPTSAATAPRNPFPIAHTLKVSLRMKTRVSSFRRYVAGRPAASSGPTLYWDGGGSSRSTRWGGNG